MMSAIYVYVKNASLVVNAMLNLENKERIERMDYIHVQADKLWLLLNLRTGSQIDWIGPFNAEEFKYCA